MPIVMTKEEKDKIEDELFLLLDYAPKKCKDGRLMISRGENTETGPKRWHQAYEFCQAAKKDAEELILALEYATDSVKKVLSEYYGIDG